MHTSSAVHPNVFFVAWAILSFGTTRTWPLPLFDVDGLVLVGRLFWSAGALLLVWAQLAFWRSGTTDGHRHASTSLITDGPFRLSRNPVYVGVLMLMAGIGIVYGSGWALLLLPLVFVAVRTFTVLPEEAYLDRLFGDDYRVYRQAVRRWL